MNSVRYGMAGSFLPRRARSLAMAAALGTAAMVVAPPASAQWYPFGPWGPAFGYRMGGAPLPPRAVAASLHHRGFIPLARPRFTGSAYVVEALNPRGDQVRLVVDAYGGRILDRARIAAAMVPPRNIGPGPGIAAGPMPGAYPQGFGPPEAPPRKKTARVEPHGPKSLKALPPAREPAASPGPGPSPAAAVPAAQNPIPAEPVPSATAAVAPAAAAPEVRPAAPALVPAAPASEAVSPGQAAPAEPAAPPQRTVRIIEGVAAVPSTASESREAPKSEPWSDPPSPNPAE